MKILTIDNPKGFVKSDLDQVKAILKGSEFKVKRKSRTQFAVYCIREAITSTEGMFEYVQELISSRFNPHHA